MARIFLIEPSEPGANEYDNIHNDLIVAVNDTIADPNGVVYTVASRLGCGQFGQVFEVSDGAATFAMKISRSDSRLCDQAIHEASILEALFTPPSPESCRISTLVNRFSYHGHVCIVLEILGYDLFRVLQHRNFIGIPLPLLQNFTHELLEALVLFARHDVVHGDIKPENIVLCDNASTSVKIIDFGVARTLDQHCPAYVQSRYYRAPEVVMRIPHGPEIDVWSLGCVICELFIAEPLFAGQSEVQLLDIIAGFIGPVPMALARQSPRFRELFSPDGSLKGEMVVCREKGIPPKIRHHYLSTETSLNDLIVEYGAGQGRNAAERRLQRERRGLLVDLLSQMLKWDPAERITPAQALMHPFVTSNFAGSRPRRRSRRTATGD